ncbi:MBL fold metallo-hydrolase [Geothrix sp. PMB-07]|uniref:MBL fold metallo-hydrolase n=1 Tax=Geothrix sp. PMB-07 TaxID=3068640 RepID=UPI002741D1C8|nr:MBL fold metallo-hydrolase [Geothrix sp. PMB-07]WLT31255.1 MBL fold metallo-hydrolase [Geothrix sp. PMB-07]
MSIPAEQAEIKSRTPLPGATRGKAGRFLNPQPLWNDYLGALASILRRDANSTPKQPLPVLRPSARDLATDSASGLRATWLGHSTVYLEINGIRVLTDPVWGKRASPFRWAGPKRFFAPLIDLEELPVPQAVVISHDHYDHLDRSTLRRIRHWDTRFIVPLGVGARLVDWGVPASRVTELDWWESTRVLSLEITCTPARHASGRTLLDKDRTLWGGFALAGPRHRAYYSGDTGMFSGLADIGARLGPFDLTLIEAGAYGQAWPDWHLGPEQAVQAHAMVQGRVLMPVHWGLFDLAAHGWTEPIERVLVAAHEAGATVAVPRPGQGFEPATLPPLERWWPTLPWKTGAEVPIRATLDGLHPQLDVRGVS